MILLLLKISAMTENIVRKVRSASRRTGLKRQPPRRKKKKRGLRKEAHKKTPFSINNKETMKNKALGGGVLTLVVRPLKKHFFYVCFP